MLELLKNSSYILKYYCHKKNKDYLIYCYYIKYAPIYTYNDIINM